MATRFGVDVGGTFTDLIFYDDQTHQLRAAKVPTVAGAQEQGITAAIRAGVPDEGLAAAKYFLHGTTVGLNALLERRGARVGLLTTQGFRDVLELRRGDWEDPYDLFWKQPSPVVPRRRRLEVLERIGTNGDIVTPVDVASVRDAVAVFAAENVEAIAIVFLNAFVNPVHELEVEEIVRASGFEGEVSLSHRVSGEHREYERTSTTVIDAYIRPIMGSYLKRLEGGLSSMGYTGDKLVTRCGGGALTFDQAAVRPFETILSGPVAGAEGAAALARALSLPSVITADVGGTSFDTALITDGRPPVLHEGRIMGMPIQTAWVDVRSIGAGGGSIAHIDSGGLLRVGPDSAGAVPGPAAYGRGGTQPTVTDAAFVLGMLGHGRLASGLALDYELAEAALAPLSAALDLSTVDVAKGIMRIATTQMAEAIREITVEQGVDPRAAALMPFGGAGGMFGTLIAGELDMKTVVAPAFAGNFSAWGLLGADLAQNASRTSLMLLSDQSLGKAQAIFGDLLADLRSRSEEERVTGPTETELGLDMRYVGQEYSLTIKVPTLDGVVTVDAHEVLAAFDVDYRRAFGHGVDAPVEIVSVRASLRKLLPPITSRQSAGTSGEVDSRESVQGYSFTRDEWLNFPVVDRDTVTDAGLNGPAIIVEHTTTSYVDAGYAVAPTAHGSLTISKIAEEA